MSMIIRETHFFAFHGIFSVFFLPNRKGKCPFSPPYVGDGSLKIRGHAKIYDFESKNFQYFKNCHEILLCERWLCEYHIWGVAPCFLYFLPYMPIFLHTFVYVKQVFFILFYSLFLSIHSIIFYTTYVIRECI